MTPFQQITAQRREQRRYEKRLREQAVAEQMRSYRYQAELAQQQVAAMRSALAIDFPSPPEFPPDIPEIKH